MITKQELGNNKFLLIKTRKGKKEAEIQVEIENERVTLEQTLVFINSKKEIVEAIGQLLIKAASLVNEV